MDAPQSKRRQPGPENLAVERVRQAQCRSPARCDDRDESLRFERLQRRCAVLGGLEVLQPEAFADGQHLEHGDAGGVDTREVLSDELLQHGRRGQWCNEVPDAIDVDERSRASVRPARAP